MSYDAYIGGPAQERNPTGFGGSRSGPSTSTRTIQVALDSQENSLGNLHNSISLLYERLTLVLAVEPPQPGSIQAEVNKSFPAIMERVDSNTRTIEAAIHRLTHLVDRLQL